MRKVYIFILIGALLSIAALVVDNETVLQGLVTKQLNISPSVGLGRIGWQSSDVCNGQTLNECWFYNNWAPTGLGTATQVYANASDNMGTMITGICATTGCGATRNFVKGDHLDVCNGNGPLDAGVIMLSNEDARSSAANQILLPNTGVPGQGVPLGFPIPPGNACAHLVYDEFDPVNNPNVLRWHIDTSNSRASNITLQYLGIFPDAVDNGVHGTYNNYRPVNAETGLLGPQGYNTTIAAGSNGFTLPQGSIFVASTTGFVGPGGSTTIIPIVVTTTSGRVGVLCTGTTGGNQFTGCTGGSGSMTTGNAVQGGLCEAGGTCLWDDYTTWVLSGTDTSTVILTGLFWPGNARPSGEGPIKILCNAGPGVLQLNNNDAGSTAANRMLFTYAANATVAVNQCITMYHPTENVGSWISTSEDPMPSTWSQTATQGTFSGNTSLFTTQNLAIGPAIAPSALTSGSTTNNWDPTGTGAGAGNAMPRNSFVRATTSSTTTATVSGMVGPGGSTNPGLKSVICNFGTGPIKFLNQSASSSAGNKFFLPFTLSFNPSVTIAYGMCVELTYDSNGNWMVNGGVPENDTSYGAIPTLSSCGTGSPTIVGTNSRGTVTEGTTTTTCTITFADSGFDTFGDVPTCTITPMNVAPGTAALTYTVSRTAIVLTNASASGDVFAYHCSQTKN